MWQFEHSEVTAAKAETIWRLYSDLETWAVWDPFIHVELQGTFQAGMKGTLQPKGKGVLDYELLEVTPLQFFSDMTYMPALGIDVSLEHTIEPMQEGTKVTHKIVITGPNVDTVGVQFGGEIAKRMPHTVESLVALAEQIERERGQNGR
ncbi:Polyketide cyclase/dehydrase [Paenibacillus curdlanolyticus YK9]|uniref:Polyketide cyclase/dehydrase n=1 Tax=Paenibacillus curdlanolyticus YK9 TaxID=717606 RepID=E0IGE1_9BACL|nr:SRPBCC family protein [Paenibacillus curdlanolyticus]EFM08441.1 Polyketide cyclase/dehydrase [Paenibacillus curdlanolyticus YK9]